MPKLTFSLFAVMHGDDDAISDTETLEAETNEALALKLASLLHGLADEIEAEISGGP